MAAPGQAGEPGMPVEAMFAGQARAWPGRPAVIAPGRTLSYAELYGLAQVLAARLAQGHGRPREPVVISVEPGWEQAVAVMAALLARVPFHPVHPQLPQAVRWQRLTRLGASAVITQPWLASRLSWPAGTACLTVADDAGGVRVREPAAPAGHDRGSGRVACVLAAEFPAGGPLVPVTSTALADTISGAGRRFGFISSDRLLVVSPLGDEVSLFGLLSMLAAGAAVVIPEDIDLRSPQAWVSLMDSEQVTVWHSPPALAALLAEHAGRTGAAVREPRLVLLGGEPLAPSLVARLRRVFGNAARIASLGGDLPAGLWSCCMEAGISPQPGRWVPLGAPLPHNRVYVLGDDMTRCEPPATGRLYFGSRGLAAGYWDDPERSAADFPVWPPADGRLHRSAQIGRLLPDGVIEVVGDDQARVVTGGDVVDLRAVEGALSCHGAVLSVAAGQAGGGLAACVKLFPGARADSAELSGFLAEQIPDGLPPVRIDVVDSLPLTLSGRLDRAALFGVADERAQHSEPQDDTAIPPGGSSRTAILACLLAAEIIGVPTIPLDANLADLGATSVQLVRLAARAEEEFEIQVDVEEFFELPSVAVLLGIAPASPAM